MWQMYSRSSSWTRSSPGTRTSHTRHSSSQADACRASASSKPVQRSADVPAVLAVGFVVLVVIGDQVLQGEAVVAGDEVYRGDRAPAVLLVQGPGAGQPGRELGDGRGLAAPEVADRVPVLPVPLTPQRREVADLIAAVAHIPRLRDQLDLGDHRILLDQVEERGQPV